MGVTFVLLRKSPKVILFFSHPHRGRWLVGIAVARGGAAAAAAARAALD